MKGSKGNFLAKGIIGEAVFDRSERYRYSLTRCWNSSGTKATFIMLNPSSADAKQNDPTISRCISFAEKLGCGSLEVVNLFAYRTAFPYELKDYRRPVGSLNDKYIETAIQTSNVIVAAWGNWGFLKGRDEVVIQLIGEKFPLFCFGLTSKGQPRHPLYLPGNTELVCWKNGILAAQA